jgi:hypothetical protein
MALSCTAADAPEDPKEYIESLNKVIKDMGVATNSNPKLVINVADTIDFGPEYYAPLSYGLASVICTDFANYTLAKLYDSQKTALLAFGTRC